MVFPGHPFITFNCLFRNELWQLCGIHIFNETKLFSWYGSWKMRNSLLSEWIFYLIPLVNNLVTYHSWICLPDKFLGKLFLSFYYIGISCILIWKKLHWLITWNTAYISKNIIPYPFYFLFILFLFPCSWNLHLFVMLSSN